MLSQVTYVGKPFYFGEYDKEIFPGHLFNVIGCPTENCELAEHIHVRSEKYRQVVTTLYPSDYLRRY